MRRFVVGRRLWLFADTVPGADAGASLCAPPQACLVKVMGGNPWVASVEWPAPCEATGLDEAKARPPLGAWTGVGASHARADLRGRLLATARVRACSIAKQYRARPDR